MSFQRDSERLTAFPQWKNDMNAMSRFQKRSGLRLQMLAILSAMALHTWGIRLLPGSMRSFECSYCRTKDFLTLVPAQFVRWSPACCYQSIVLLLGAWLTPSAPIFSTWVLGGTHEANSQGGVRYSRWSNVQAAAKILPFAIEGIGAHWKKMLWKARASTQNFPVRIVPLLPNCFRDPSL